MPTLTRPRGRWNFRMTERLRTAQRTWAQGQLAEPERAQAMAELYDVGHTHQQIAEICNEVSRALGAPEITESAVGKVIGRLRRRLDGKG